jgi:hypothetical protein
MDIWPSTPEVAPGHGRLAAAPGLSCNSSVTNRKLLVPATPTKTGLKEESDVASAEPIISW